MTSYYICSYDRERLDVWDITPLLSDFASRSELCRRLIRKFD
jgi:hypothetical protein